MKKYLTTSTLLRQARSRIKQVSDFFGALAEKTLTSFETKEKPCFTTTNEETDGCLHTSAPGAVRANPASLKGVAGFTLVELIISIAIFAMVSTAILTSLLSVINASRQQQAKNDAVDSLNYVVDDMVRRIRTGYNFSCGVGSGVGDCDNGRNSFSFTASEVGGDATTNDRIRYSVSSNNLRRNIIGSGVQQLTGPPLEITDLQFRVTGSASDTGDDAEQSRVLLVITGQVDDGNSEPQEFSIQTTVTQRLLYSPAE